MFISTVVHLTASTAAAARKEKHNSLSSDNVFSALEKIEFEHFIEPLRDALDSFRTINKMKESSKTNANKTDDTITVNSNDDEMDEDMNPSMQEQTGPENKE